MRMLPYSGSVSPVQLYKDKITSTGLLKKLVLHDFVR